MSRPEHIELAPRPDARASESEEFLPVVVTQDGHELGVREPIKARATFEQALADAQDFARRWPAPTRALVLRRTLGPWELADR